MKNKKQKRLNGLYNRPKIAQAVNNAVVFGVAALVISTVAYVGMFTDKKEQAAAKPPTINTATLDADEGPDSVSVTLKGNDFAPGATVKWGERAPSEVVHVSSTTLRAVTTGESSAGDTIMVTNPDGQSAVVAAGSALHAPDRAKVSVLNLSVVLSNIGRQNPAADFSNDGNVDTRDLAVLSGTWAW